MKVLFYEDILTNNANFSWRLGHVEFDSPIYHNLIESGVDCTFIMSEQAEDCFAEVSKIRKEDRIVISEAEMMATLAHPQDRVCHMFHDAIYAAPAPEKIPLDVEIAFQECIDQISSVSDKKSNTVSEFGLKDVGRLLSRARSLDAVRRLSRYFQMKLPQGYEPDVIVTWVPVPFLRNLFPDALILHREAGMFAHDPFPRTMYLDPVGFHSHSWVVRNRASAHSDEPEALEALETLRQHYLPSIAQSSPFPFLDDLRKPYETLLLVATQFNDYFLWDEACAYRSQMQMLIDIFEQIPDSWGVVIGQHPSHKKLSSYDVATLKRRYPNLIWDERIESTPRASQWLLSHCDAVATVSSSIGLQALFWGKPLIALGDSHLTPFGFDPNLDAGRQRQQNDEHVAWQLLHYCIPDQFAEIPGFFREYFEDRIERASGAEPSYFDQPIAPLDQIVDALMGKSVSPLSSSSRT